MEKKKLQNISIAALIISVLPFATLIPVFLKSYCPMDCVQFGVVSILPVSSWGCACPSSVLKIMKAGA